jgi:hypothetical protein
MNDIVKILGTQKRLENENFEIYRFGTIEFNNIGKFEPTQEIVNHESKITPQTSAGSIPESQFTEISEQTKISKFSEESFKGGCECKLNVPKMYVIFYLSMIFINDISL